MITGIVTDSMDAIVEVRVVGEATQGTTVAAVIDTGFNGYLTLPRPVIQSLGLHDRGVRRAQLADGQMVLVRLYRATAVWNDQNRAVQIVEAEGSPLIGMAMLRGFRLSIDVESRGSVLVESLS